jgi:hypothetical protein
MVPPVLFLALLLTGCGPQVPVAAGDPAAPGPSIPIFYRTPVDMAVSLATGLDCSVVNLDKDQRYCRPREGPPETQEFCTRSLGVVDCWAQPSKVPNSPKEVADGPRALTPSQERDRTKWWPGL